MGCKIRSFSELLGEEHTTFPIWKHRALESELDPDPSNPMDPAGAPAIEPIHAAYQAHDEVLGSKWDALPIWFCIAIAYTSFLVCRLILASLGMSPMYAAVLLGVELIAVAAFFVHRRRGAAPWGRARDGMTSDAAFRLRVVGEGASVNSLVQQAQAVATTFSEPFIARSLLALSTAPDDVPARDKAIKSLPRGQGSQTISDLSNGQRALGIGAAISLAAAFYFVPRWVLHNDLPFGIFQTASAAIGAALLLSVVSPTYIRISPGTLDVLRFGWEPRSHLRFERFDLSRALILIDTRRGVIRIRDESRASRRTLIIRSRLIAARPGAIDLAVLSAARCTDPSPPLPESSLAG